MSEGAVIATATPLIGVALSAAVEGSGYRPASLVATADGLVALARARPPALALVDLATPHVVPAVREICVGRGRTTVVVLADDGQDDLVVRLVSDGVVGAVPRAAAPGALERALTAVRAGQAAIPRSLVGRVMTELRVAAARPQADGTPALTRREQQILELMNAGFSMSAIAARLVVAPVTVRTHVCAIRRKLRSQGTAVTPPLLAG